MGGGAQRDGVATSAVRVGPIGGPASGYFFCENTCRVETYRAPSVLPAHGVYELEYIYIQHACLYGEHLVIFPSMCMRTCGLCCAGRATCAPTVPSKRPLAQILYEMQLAYQLFMHGFRGAAQILYE